MTQTLPLLPLLAHEVLRASSTSVYVAWCEQQQLRHAIMPVGDAQALDVRISRRSFPGGCLEVARGGDAAVRVECVGDEGHYQLILPVTGRGRLQLGCRDVALEGYVAGALLGPGQQHSFALSGGWADLSVYVDGGVLLSCLRNWSGDEDHALPEFEPGVAVGHASTTRLRALTAGLFREADDGSSDERLSVLLERWCLALLRALPGDHRPIMWADDPLASRRHVRVAEEFMEANLTRPLRMTEVAQEVGVGLRALQKAFLAFRARRPLAVLKGLRLERARARLTQEPGLSVRAAAEHSGLSHMGRFSTDYRRAFGESPSVTRRRARPVPFSALGALASAPLPGAGSRGS